MNGGSPMTKYTVTPLIGGVAQTAVDVTGSPLPTSTQVTGLTNGHGLHVHRHRHQCDRHWAASGPSNSVTPTRPTAPGAPTAVSATAGDTTATVDLDGPGERGQPDDEIHGDPFDRRDRADRGRRDRLAAADLDDGDRVDEWHRLHVHRHRHQCDRHWAAPRPVELGDTDRANALRRADRRQRDGRRHHRHGDLDGPGERGQPADEIHGDSTDRRGRAEPRSTSPARRCRRRQR